MEIKYDNQEEIWGKSLEDKTALTWLEDNNLDRWRHRRLLDQIKPLLKPNSTWLTLGDGRYGTEANYLLNNGCNAYASDISDNLLKVGNEIGFIKEYGAQNAEKLLFKDESFDYVLIKEAFHHFPRPWLALYEAFRVCKKGVILIEPFEKKGFLVFIKTIIYKLLKKPKPGHGFEEVGNYIYSIEPKELEKFLLGMHFRKIAWKFMNDHYFPGIEFINLNKHSFRQKLIIYKLKIIIFVKNIFCLFFKGNHDLITSILFKEEPNNNLINKLKKGKWIYKNLPKNPYIDFDK